DYVPAGFNFFDHLNTAWTPIGGGIVKTVIDGPLAPGESEVVTISLQLKYTSAENGYVNVAEIAYSEDGNNNPADDIDSDSDTNPNNDAGGKPNSDSDDSVIGDGSGNPGDGDATTDEDDSDPWGIEVASIGDYVWNDLNDNGIQDDGAPNVVGVQDVTVRLYDIDGHNILNVQTDENGRYLFENLVPGEYYLKFEDLPAGAVWTQQNAGNDDLDSDVDQDGLTISTVLDAGENDLSWDAGIVQLASVGDYVWLDTNENGVQDAGESAVDGVVVHLLDENGDRIATTVTDESGYYIFDGLRPGTYSVEFVKPAELEFTGKGQGTDDTKDSDVNVATGKTDQFVLQSGENITKIDAGLRCTMVLELTPPQVLCKGDTVVIESNITGGAPEYIYDWSTGEHTPTIEVT
ncbi:MAG: hypothetical protein CSA19_01875, partial [Deltaproteobacteria bacterium]